MNYKIKVEFKNGTNKTYYSKYTPSYTFDNTLRASVITFSDGWIVAETILSVTYEEITSSWGKLRFPTPEEKLENHERHIAGEQRRIRIEQQRWLDKMNYCIR